jgi:hypothetical protein
MTGVLGIRRSLLMRKSFTAVVLVAGMALGSVLTMALNPVGAASALVGASPAAKGSHQNILQQALSTLVGNGTITQKQSDAIQGQVKQDQGAFWAKRPPLGRQDVAKVAFLLGIDAATLRTDLRSGLTIAQVATAKGISPATLAGQVTTLLDKAIDAQVAAHHLTAARAATMKANLPARITALLNRTWGHRLGARHAAKPGAAPTTPTTSGGASTSTTSPSTTVPASSTSSSSSTSTTSPAWSPAAARFAALTPTRNSSA